jgi:bidirectional [NiFe] hydrogenase diaphorase subunit
MLIPVTIDGEHIEVEKGTTVLEAAIRLNIRIPSLCYHEAIEPYGSCRLCQVEVESRGRRRLRTACEYPVLKEGDIVYTSTEPVQRMRRLVLELLLARCPDVPVLTELARELGLTRIRFETVGSPSDCILCGLCERACNEVLGINAICFVGRGAHRRLGTPYEVNSDACIGCGACASVCPTGAIRVREYDGKRHLRFWNTTVDLRSCRSCGEQFIPNPTLLFARDKTTGLEDVVTLCPSCRSQSVRTCLVAGLRKVV